MQLFHFIISHVLSGFWFLPLSILLHKPTVKQSSFALSISFRRCFRITESHLCFARNSSSWNNTFDVFFVSGATKEIGKSLTRLCLRHRSIESKLKLYTKYVWCNNKHFRWVQLVPSNHICSKSKLKSATPTGIPPSVRIEIGKCWVYIHCLFPWCIFWWFSSSLL